MILLSLFLTKLTGFCVNKKCVSTQFLYTCVLRKCIKTVVHLGGHCSVIQSLCIGGAFVSCTLSGGRKWKKIPEQFGVLQ